MRYTAGGIFKAYCVTGIPFGVCMGIVLGVQFGAVKGIVNGTVCSVLFCGILILWLSRINKKYLPDTDGETDAVFGTVEAHAVVCSTKSCSEIQAELSNFAKNHEYRMPVCDTHKICIRTKASFRSWGERIIVLLAETDSGTTEITVSSRPKVRTTLYDYGINKRNVELIKTVVSG